MKAKGATHYFEVADPKVTKTGFIAVCEHNLYLLMMKSGLLGGAEDATIKIQTFTSNMPENAKKLNCIGTK